MRAIESKRTPPFAALIAYVAGVLALEFDWLALLRPVDGDRVLRAEFLTMLLVSVVISAAFAILAELIRPKPDIENAKPASKGEFNFPTATEGRVVDILFGRDKISGPNVVWWGDFRQVPVKEKVKTGILSKKSIITGYKFFFGMQLAFARGFPTANVSFHKIFVGEKLLETAGSGAFGSTLSINQPAFLGGDDFGSGGIVGDLEIFNGSLTQAKSTYLGGFQDPYSANRGTAYIVFAGGYHGNSTKIPAWACEASCYPSGLRTVTPGGHNYVAVVPNSKVGDDLNPIEVLYECITNTEWGMRKSSTKVDITSFADAAVTLFNEGNGFSLRIESGRPISDLINLIQDQIDGVMYFDRNTGKYAITLARQETPAFAYDLDESTILAIKDFTRQTWDGTANQVRISFVDRARDYFETFARADSLANQRMQSGEVITITKNFPGCKSGTLANALASRVLRTHSFPFCNARMIVNRKFWNVNAGTVLLWTSTVLGFTDLRMRVIRADFGEFEGGDITLTLVQDVFSLEAGFFGVPPPPGWVYPTQGVAQIPINQHTVFEAPRALVDRDPEITLPDRVFVGARAQAGEIRIGIYQRNDATDPTALPYAKDGTVEGLFLIGTLNVATLVGDANPTGTIQITGAPDSLVRINFAFDPDGATAAEIGQQLANIILIDNEFIGVSGLTVGGSTADFTVCYRGMLDSVPAAHSAGALVYALWVAGGLNDSQIAAGRVVDVQPRTESRDAELSSGLARTFRLTMANRYRKPYPPYRLDIETVRFDTTITLNNVIAHATGDDLGFDADWYRRDWDTTDEVESLTADAGVLDAGFQAKHGHQNRLVLAVTDLEGFNAPAGFGAGGWLAGTTDVASRADALSMNDGALPVPLVVSVAARHTFETVVYESLYNLDFPTSASDSSLSGLTNLGTVFANGPISRTFTRTPAGSATYTLTLGTAITGVEFRQNAGAWTAIVLLGLVAQNDTLEFRHADTSGVPLNTVGVLDAAGTPVAYVIFHTGASLASLVGYWTMRETSTGVSPVNRSARFGGASAFVDNNNCDSAAGKFGLAARVRSNGTTEAGTRYLTISNALALSKNLLPTTSFAAMLWVRMAVGSTSGNPTQTFLSNRDFSSVPNTCFSIIADASGITVQVNGTSGGVFTRSFSYGSGSNHVPNEDRDLHIALRFDDSLNEIRLIVDGVDRGSTAMTEPLESSDQPLAIGAAYSAGVVSPSNSARDARIDDARIYLRSPSVAEITAIATATKPLF